MQRTYHYHYNINYYYFQIQLLCISYATYIFIAYTSVKLHRGKLAELIIANLCTPQDIDPANDEQESPAGVDGSDLFR